jgi:hypothetical protein
MSEKKFNKKWLIPVGLIAGAALVGSGVFASTTITLNSGNAISLGAGAQAVNVCGSSATIAASQTFNTSSQSYQTQTITINNVATACNGKTMSMSYLDSNSVVHTATWTLGNSTSNNYIYGQLTNGSNSGSNYYAYSTLSPFDTAAQPITTIAIAVS